MQSSGKIVSAFSCISHLVREICLPLLKRIANAVAGDIVEVPLLVRPPYCRTEVFIVDVGSGARQRGLSNEVEGSLDRIIWKVLECEWFDIAVTIIDTHVHSNTHRNLAVADVKDMPDSLPTTFGVEVHSTSCRTPVHANTLSGPYNTGQSP